MGYYDELDREIDQEMGWADDIKKEARRGRAPGTTLLCALSAIAKKLQPPRAVAKALGGAGRIFRKTLLFPLISPLSYSKSFNLDGDMLVIKRSWKWRIVDAVLTRLMVAPIIIGVFLLGIVYFTTHPERVHADATPESLGIYYKSVRLVTIDGQELAAWYLPPITAGDMSFDPETSFTQKWPGVVICHGLGASQDQYLPLSQELHAAGFAVLMVDMRGQGESDPAAVTYGLRERLDVLAGVSYLGELPNIDTTKVCVVGHDIGALASLQAAALNSSIAAVVADGMWPRFEDRARNIFTHPTHAGDAMPTGWLAPLYTITFEVAIRDRLNQLDLNAMVRNIHTQPALFVARLGSKYASVAGVLSLASSVGAHHEVLVADESVTAHTVDTKIRDFLIASTHWTGPKAKGTRAIQRLLNSRVHEQK